MTAYRRILAAIDLTQDSRAVAGRACEIARDKPVVAICQTGQRSGLATVSLRKLGFDRVANLAGGMVRWRDLGLPD